MTARRIIVGYDRSTDAKAAARWALDEALRTGATVEFLYAYEWPAWLPATSTVPAPSVWPDGETDRAIQGALNEAAAMAKQSHPSVPTHVTFVHNSAALELIGRSAGAGLIVLGCRGHSGVTGLLGSVSVAVSAHAKCPVVVVRGEPAGEAPVVVGVDDSPAAQVALAYAVEAAVARGVGLRVIRAWPPVTGLWEQSSVVTREVPASLDELIAGWQRKHPELAISAEAVVAHPAAALVEAGRDAQLLVVGTRGRGAVLGMVLGSVSQHVLRHSPCTVVVAHGEQ